MSAILVVEDNPQNMHLLRILLELEGHDVMAASSAQEARDALAKRRPDLLLVDIKMPGEDGVSLLRSIRADPGTQGLCMVAMTAHAIRGDQKRFLELGFDGYQSKPIDVRRFANQLQEYLKAPFVQD